MSRKNFEAPSGSRSSALWGTGNRGGESRSNALWGKGGRGRLLMTIALVALAAPIAAVADSGSSKHGSAACAARSSLRACSRRPSRARTQLVQVIIQSVDGDTKAASAFKDADRTRRQRSAYRRGPRGHEGPSTSSSNSVAVHAEGEEARAPREDAGPDGDARTRRAADGAAVVEAHLADRVGREPAVEQPVQGRPEGPDDRDRRLGHRQEPARLRHRRPRRRRRRHHDSSEPNSPGDGRGHGTFVAGIAAGSARTGRRLADLGHLIARRHGRQRHGAHERRHRGCRVDPPEHGKAQHPGRELLAPLDDAEQLHQRPARQGGREALVRRRGRRRGLGQLRQRRTGRAASSTPPATIRS